VEQPSPEGVSDGQTITDPATDSDHADGGTAEQVAGSGQDAPIPIPFDVEVDASDRVCYALAHNRVPIVDAIRIRSSGAGQSDLASQLRISVESHWSRDGRPPVQAATIAIEAPGPGQTIELSPVSDVRLDDIALADLEELIPAELAVTVSDDQGRATMVTRSTAILSRTQWLSAPRWRAITAAFVQPNHPEVADIITSASKRLGRAGLDPAMSGYQGAENGQHHRIAKAIFEELQSRVSNYVNPPASFEDEGQKLRPLDQVLGEKQGTCIDLACALASCFEAAGLHPVVVFVAGHAFGGYLTQEVVLNREYLDSWPEVQNIFDSGLLVPIETVLLCEDDSFEDAVEVARQHFNPTVMEGVLDVASAHRNGIRPLPAQVRRGDELIVVIDNGPSEPPVIERRDPVSRRLLPESVPARVQNWKNALLDLSFRNRLLNLRVDRSGLQLLPPLGKLGYVEDRLTNGDGLLVHAADDINETVRASIAEGKERIVQNAGAEILEMMLFQASSLFSGSVGANFKKRASRLRSDARLIEEDSGANNLYLTLGSLTWGEPHGTYSSPIFLVPVRVHMARGSTKLAVHMDDTQSTVPNYCLIEALRAKEQMKLQWFADDMSDELGLDVEAGLQALRDELRERGLDRRGFTVEQTASLAILDFKKFRLWRDLDEHWSAFLERPVVRHLVETPRVPFNDPNAGEPVRLDDSTLLSPQPADGSQLKAIARALSNQSFVLEGPPGTGKSQTITNLLANAVYQGKKVLFVAEKQAALSVVHERLGQVGLDPYCLELHDRGTTLKAALEQQPQFDERHMSQFEDEFASLAMQLERYHSGLYSENEAGYSFAGAFTRLMDLGPGRVAAIPRAFLDNDAGTVADVRHRITKLDPYLAAAQVTHRHAWRLARGRNFADLDRTALAALITETCDLADELAGITGPTGRLAQAATCADDLASAGAVISFKESGVVLPSADWASVGDPDWASRVSSAMSELETAAATARELAPGDPTVIRRTDLDGVEAAVVAAVGSFPLGRAGRLRSALGDVATAVGPAASDRSALPGIITRLATASTAAQKAIADLRAMPGIAGVEADIPVSDSEIDALAAAIEMRSTTAVAIRRTDALGEAARGMLAATEIPIPGLGRRITRMASTLSELGSMLGSTESSELAWAGGSVLDTLTGHAGAIWRTAVESGTYLTLQRWLDLQTELDALRAVGLDELCDGLETGDLPGLEATAAFDRGVLTTTMTVRAEELQFDIFDREHHDHRVRQFIDMLAERSKLAQTAIPHGLFRSRRVQPGVTTGKVGEFQLEVSKSGRQRGRSIRRLIERFPEIISDLTPCFLMSPDSVAQFLPPGTIEFDLVVFDEASQITVADAIGALGRANAVVIVGDSRQMPPTRFGVAGVGDEDAVTDADEEVGIDEDSILEEALQAGFTQEWLSWHYRSQDESLIDFSNQHYYDSRLATFPAPIDRRPDCGIFYRRVQGQFDHGKTRTNPVEAEAVIEEIVRRLDDPATAGLTYGIITLNLQQRQLIERLLTDHPHPGLRELRDSDDPERRLFVLNLENVQGRERDVIVMGTAFSRRAGGGSLPLQFGPLTNPGGEKRLNVAVTRAKRQFVVVSSFDPADMAEPKSLGLIHLKEYLSRAAATAAPLTYAVDGVAAGSESPDPYVAQICERLRERGIKATTSRGLSTFKVDLALSLPDRDDWLVAVLLDGPEWSRRTLVMDRDALPVQVLESMMGWRRVARVWMPSWRVDPDDVIDALVDLVHAAAAQPAPSSVAPPAARTTKDEESPTTSDPDGPVDERFGSLGTRDGGDGRHDAVDPVVTMPNVALQGAEVITRHADPAALGVSKELDLLPPRAASLARSIVETEGPIASATVLKRVANAYGIDRVRQVRLDAMAPLLSGLTLTEWDHGEVVWPVDKDPETWRGFRLVPVDQRPVADVPAEELINLMEAIIRQSISISPEELIRACLNQLGAQQLTAPRAAVVAAAIELACERQRFVVDGDALCLP
jgi:hypothetical protein